MRAQLLQPEPQALQDLRDLMAVSLCLLSDNGTIISWVLYLINISIMVPLLHSSAKIPNSKEAYSNCARPARDVEVEQVDLRCSANDVPRSNTLSDAQDDLLRSEQTVQVPVLPRTPASKDRGYGRLS